MVVLHVNWTGGALWIWGESADSARRLTDTEATGASDGAAPHPFACDLDALSTALSAIGLTPGPDAAARLTLRLPTASGRPAPSPTLAHSIGWRSTGLESAADVSLEDWDTPAIGFATTDAARVLERLEDLADRAAESEETPAESASSATCGPSVEYFATAARFARSLVAQQRITPMVVQDATGALRGAWSPWLSDEKTSERAAALLRSMPGIARAVHDEFEHQPWPILQDFLGRFVDQMCRRALARERMIEAIEDRSTEKDLQVAWLAGLLDREEGVPALGGRRSQLVRGVRDWVATLDDRGSDVEWRLCLRLNEPFLLTEPEDFASPDEDFVWSISFHLQSVDREGVMLDADEIWSLTGESTAVDGRRVEDPKHLLLAELARAARIYNVLERVLAEDAPTELELTTNQSYNFLREIRPLLLEQGFGVITPKWWESPAARVGARLEIDSDPLPPGEEGGPARSFAGDARFGLETLVDYRWRIAVGDKALSLKDFESLASKKTPLVRVGGKWVEIRPEDVRAAMGFISENPGGKIRVADALRLAYSSDASRTGVPILGMNATGWVATLFGEETDDRPMPSVEHPEGFMGSLRPYQLKGVAWLGFLDRFGLGACLADDMGLGKTIQLLALLQLEHEEHRRAPAEIPKPGPTLVVAPMSVVGNWRREAARFVPTLKVIVHHGLERLSGDRFVEAASSADLVVTTYALAHRDREDIERVPWRRVALDEAQNIKNPSAKQTQALRSIDAPRRVALTGTPVENRLSELWSIMEFCNPGYLGGPTEFRRRFSLPIERRHDRRRSEQLRTLVRPFILRRLKTDPAVTADLPEKVVSKEYCPLTPEQARLYEQTVQQMLSEVDQAEGMRRRGVVLATLIKLKQICNHPAQALKEVSTDGAPPDPARSGKCVRLLEMLEEAISVGDQALVFTQFRQMGDILAPLIAQRLDRDILFLHGGTTQKAREQMIERFQKADGAAPVFILSLRAGGLGMNLTAASHVFHFDRWWNPAVENQATDRAHRIGQTRTVQVHKFVVSGTLEERIDEMLEQKSELAERIISSGEQWLTELSTSQLRDLLTLREDAVTDE